MSLHDELVDVTVRILVLPSEAEALGEWAAVLGRLGRIGDAVGRRAPTRRRSPRIDGAVNWLRRSLHDAPITVEVRAVAEGLIGRIKPIGSPVVVKKKLVPADEVFRLRRRIR
jgi:hypothetical protein